MDTTLITSDGPVSGYTAAEPYRGFTFYNYQQKIESPEMRYTKTNTSLPANYDTVIFPYDSATAPSITVTRLPVTVGGVSKQPYEASGLQISGSYGGNSFTDYYFINHTLMGTVTYGNFTFNGEAVYIRKNASGTIIQVRKYPSSSVLTQNGVEVKLPTGELTAPESGTVINSNTVNLTATATPYTGNTISNVGFYAVYFDGKIMQYPLLVWRRQGKSPILSTSIQQFRKY